MPRAFVLVAFLGWAAALTLACGSPVVPSQPTQTNSGLNVTGTVDRAPTPTCPAGEPCDPQMVAVSLVFTGTSGHEVSTRVSGDGSFALHLEPGDYAIGAAPPAFGAELDPSNVRVPMDGSVTLHLHFVKPA